MSPENQRLVLVNKKHRKILKWLLPLLFLACFLQFFTGIAHGDELEKAIHYFNKGEYDRTIGILSVYKVKEPKNHQIAFYLGYSFLKNRKYSRALSHFEKAVELEPGDIRSYYLRGISRFSLKLPSAASDFKKVVQRLPLSPIGRSASAYLDLIDDKKRQIFKTNFNQALSLFKKGDYTGSSRAFDKLAAKQPKNATVLYYAGYSRFKEMKYDQAIAFFNKSLQLETGNETTLFMKALTLRALGKPKKGDQILSNLADSGSEMGGVAQTYLKKSHRPGRKNNWYYHLQMGLDYDTNPGYLPENGLSSGEKPDPGAAFSLFMSGGVEGVTFGPGQFEFQVSAFQRLYTEIMSPDHQTSLYMGLGYGVYNKKVSYGVRAGGGTFLYDFKPFDSMGSLSAWLKLGLTENIALGSEAEIYLKTVHDNAYEYLQGKGVRVRPLLSFMPGGKELQLDLGGQFYYELNQSLIDQESSEFYSFSYKAVGPSAYISWFLPSDLHLRVGANLLWKNYLDLTTSRPDRLLDISSTLVWSGLNFSQLFFQVSFQGSNSPLSFRTYQKFLFSSGVIFR